MNNRSKQLLKMLVFLTFQGFFYWLLPFLVTKNAENQNFIKRWKIFNCLLGAPLSRPMAALEFSECAQDVFFGIKPIWLRTTEVVFFIFFFVPFLARFRKSVCDWPAER